MNKILPTFGPLEMKILGLIEQNNPQSVTEVQEALAREKTDLAYTTVMTILTRLAGKGVLTRKKEGRQFLYSPAKKEGIISQQMLQKVKKTFFGKERLRPILSLIEQGDDLSVDELQELKKIVDAKLASNKSDNKPGGSNS